MEIYDKASWHIDAGENQQEVLEKFDVVFSVLQTKGMLTEEGKEVFELGIDKDVSLHERLLTLDGNIFLKDHYDSVINLKSNEIAVKLLNL